MALDRWVSFVILCAALAYGYAAFFTMDASLPPFMQRNPIWPSTFPKVLAVLTVLTSLAILLGLEKSQETEKEPEIDYRRLGDYHLGQALTLLGLMVAYALLLRPAGFLFATFAFLSCGAFTLGERKFHVLLPVAALASFVVWYLVDEVLGIFLRPWPFFA
ncbi:tripartite tricarboxylate transporter TctB family protein [Thalassovita mediterranea]|jgi:putative tricarboxylic transport membrane protein|uniref:Tripartite tricarboxylate transporter TctB family protein n=1 Tax=Thalassovita mediterranea TaxID=340021 RepID=A0A0P1GM73_9RHOB|nr:tripartite tricarboxylate transporter TctB family protein [Thalassovita mediterranea]CUH83266.1 Tripartite tricarboxylate transporter TctB family protein [Thalassovita mediterranea]SIS33785.1 putative tricarboxylic transport membrane protein [Thalassovita mediterranea]